MKCKTVTLIVKNTRSETRTQTNTLKMDDNRQERKLNDDVMFCSYSCLGSINTPPDEDLPG